MKGVWLKRGEERMRDVKDKSHGEKRKGQEKWQADDREKEKKGKVSRKKHG